MFCINDTPNKTTGVNLGKRVFTHLKKFYFEFNLLNTKLIVVVIFLTHVFDQFKKKLISVLIIKVANINFEYSSKMYLPKVVHDHQNVQIC